MKRFERVQSGSLSLLLLPLCTVLCHPSISPPLSPSLALLLVPGGGNCGETERDGEAERGRKTILRVSSPTYWAQLRVTLTRSSTEVHRQWRSQEIFCGVARMVIDHFGVAMSHWNI